jgi:hypothetical protein
MPTLVEVEGFEHQIKAVNATATMDPPLWGVSSDAGNRISFVTGRDGIGKAMRIAPDGTNQARVQRTLTTPGTLFVHSIYIRLNSTPTGANCRCYLVSADQIAIIGINTSGAIIATWGGGTGPTTVTGPSLTDGLWHRVDIRVNTSPATHTIEWSVDGSAQTNSTTGGVASSNITSFTCGTNQTTSTASFDLDDLVISATTGDHPLGAHTVYSKVPSADGSYAQVGTNIMENASTGVDISASEPAWSKLDEWPVTTGLNNADSVTSKASGATNYAEVTFSARPSYATSTAWGVTAIVAHQSDTVGANTGISRIVDSAGTTLTDIFSGDMSEITEHYTRRIITAPAGGWTTTNLDGVKGRVGFGTLQPGEPEWLALMLQVATPDIPTVNGTASPSVVARTGAVPAPTAKGDGTTVGPIIVTELTEGKDSTDLSTYTTAQISPKASALLVLSISWSASSGAGDPTVTSPVSLTWQKVTSDVTTEIFGAGIWVARTASGAPPAPQVVDIAFGSAKTGISWHIAQLEFVDLSGADALASIIQSRAGNTSAGITSDTFDFSSPMNYDSVGFAAWGLNAAPGTTLSTGSNIFEVYNDTRAAPAAVVVVDYNIFGTGAGGFGWSFSSSGRAVRAIAEIKAARLPTPAIGSVPAPTAFSAGSGTASPSTVAGTGAVPAPTAKGNGTTVPAVVAGVGAVPAPTATGGSAPGKTRRLLIRGTGGPR